MSMLAPVKDRTTTEAPSEPGDHDKFSHYVRKTDIMESAFTGKPARALCGKKWRPNADPERFSVCQDCKAIYEQMGAW